MMKRQLDVLLAEQRVAAHLQSDPLGIVREFAADADREVVGLLAASLAFGNVLTIRRSVRRVLGVLGESPADYLSRVEPRVLGSKLRSFRHRVYRGTHVTRLLIRAAEVRREYGSIGSLMTSEYAGTGGDFREALAAVADRLRGPRADRGMAHLVSDPRAGSACKRLLLYSRWMVRQDDGVDLGLWELPTSALVMPLDTHVHRMARNLGLTERNDASWKTAEEVTEALRELDPHDPVKYDFALCHMGVSRQCPSRRDPQLCEQCSLRSVCGHWA
jgi:uncharacterized protein (TIGR02757 family)